MSGYRTIGRQTTNAAPAWRAAMASTNTLYAVGTTPALSGITATWVYPSGSIPSRWGNVNSERAKWAGFGGAVYLPDHDAHGRWVFNQTGEAVWENNAQAWTMSSDTPTFVVWDQPQYHTDLAACVSAGDDVYYSPTDAANTSIVPAANSFTNESLLESTWNKTFPLALNDWVWRRKQQGFTLKANQPHWFRYNTPAVVPAWAARTTKSVIVAKENNLHGPFSQAWRPAGAGMTDSDFHTDIWPSGRRKQYAYWQDTSSHVWSKISTPVPDMTPRDAFSDHSAWDSSTRRLYYWATLIGTYYLDLSAGIASATFSAVTSTTGANVFPEYDRGGTVFTDKHPTGKRLIYFRSSGGGHVVGNTHVGLLDLATNVIYDLDLASRGLDPGSNWSMQFGYDAATNTVYITSLAPDQTPRLHTFVVPSDPTIASNYTVTTTVLGFASGVAMEPSFSHKPSGRGALHKELGVILITQEDETMLAFRPA